MGNSFGCSASGERLVSAARDGDLVEAKMLLEFNPCLAKYSTFGGLNSPLHFAAAKGHNEIVALLLENGADVNSRNYCGQIRALGGCADLIALQMQRDKSRLSHSVPLDSINNQDGDGSGARNKHDQSALSKFVNTAADGGITALHMAALNGNFDCVQLLLDLHANVSAVTFHYGASMDLIGAGSTPIHYAACGGSLKCCQILLARGASRLTLNCNGWLPVDVAKMWGRHWLEPLLAVDSESVIPVFPPSKYLALPLMSVLEIARESGMLPSCTSNDYDTCAVCLERVCSVAAEGCGHQLCVKCALYICLSCNVPPESVGLPGSIPCPFCRHGILAFLKLQDPQVKETEIPHPLSFCTPCILHLRDSDDPTTAASTPGIVDRCAAAVSSDLFFPVSCTPFSSVTMPLCKCTDGPCPPFEPRTPERADESPRQSLDELDKTGGPWLDRVICSTMFWGRRSCSREQQCNSEINT